MAIFICVEMHDYEIHDTEKMTKSFFLTKRKDAFSFSYPYCRLVPSIEKVNIA